MSMEYKLDTTHSLAGFCTLPDERVKTEIRIKYVPNEGVTFDWVRPFDSYRDEMELFNNNKLPHISEIEGTLISGENFKLIDCQRARGSTGTLGHYKWEHWRARVLAISDNMDSGIPRKMRSITMLIDGVNYATDTLKQTKHSMLSKTIPFTLKFSPPRQLGSTNLNQKESLSSLTCLSASNKEVNTFTLTCQRMAVLKLDNPISIDDMLSRARGLRRFHSMLAGMSLPCSLITTNDSAGNTTHILHQRGFQKSPKDFIIQQSHVYDSIPDYTSLYWQWQSHIKELSGLAASWEYYDANSGTIEESLSALLFALEGAARKANIPIQSSDPRRRYPMFSERLRSIIAQSPGYSDHILQNYECRFIEDITEARHSLAHDLDNGPASSLERIMHAGRLRFAVQSLTRHYILAKIGIPEDRLVALAKSQHVLRKHLDTSYA